jgi:hypothetical protein
MGKTLLILEVSQKQAYIFSSKELKENAERSAIIDYVTSSAFFRAVLGADYREAEQLVYTGGGHTVLQFADREEATRFAQQVTEAALRTFDGLALFAAQLPYDASRTPGENLTALTQTLERKKSLRRASLVSFGVEKLDGTTFRLAQASRPQISAASPWPIEWTFPTRFDEVAGDDNFLAVVHIDGNAMGTRVAGLYEHGAADWDRCCRSLRQFSRGIQADFETAFRQMVETVLAAGYDAEQLPLRPIILAGDDVCFVTAGNLGLECARVFLEKLTALTNEEDGQPYAACAGVALVHQKYPFHLAYDLAESLCSNAKRFCAALDPAGRVSAMDWHIEFGQLKGSLSELREEYATEDGNRLELRPVTVVVPEGVRDDQTQGFRTYGFFAALCRGMQDRRGSVPRGKLKELRSTLRQGEIETRFYLNDRQIQSLLDQSFPARYRTAAARREQYQTILDQGQVSEKTAFLQFGEDTRCLFFDAIELLDHWKPLEEVQK